MKAKLLGSLVIIAAIGLAYYFNQSAKPVSDVSTAAVSSEASSTSSIAAESTVTEASSVAALESNAASSVSAAPALKEKPAAPANKPKLPAVVEGKDYQLLAKPQAVAVPGKLEVIEFFWYGCSHCYAIEPFVERWEKKLPSDVNFRRVHVMWPGRTDIAAHAKIFLGLEATGEISKYQQSVFDAIQRDGIELRSDSVLKTWLKDQKFDQARFMGGYNAFSTNANIVKLEKMAQDYGVDGVPVFFVNGKYMTSPGMVNKADDSFFDVINALLEKERTAKK